MKKLNMLLMGLVTLASTSQVFAQALTADQKKQRIVASYRTAVGRMPVQGEIDHWAKQRDLTVQELVNYHIQYAGNEASFKKQIIELSYRHALGRNPTTGAGQNKQLELEWWMSQPVQSYAQMMRNHVTWLDQNKKTTAYSDVINLAYNKVYGRPASAAENAAWLAKPTTSYGMMVGALKDYSGRGNQGALGQITNIANQFMSGFQLSDNQTVQQVATLLGSTPEGKVLTEGAGAVTSALGYFLPFFNL